MSIKINVGVVQTLRNVTQNNRALVILTHAVKDDVKFEEKYQIIESVGELNAVYTHALNKDDDNALFELDQVKFLLEAGVGVVTLQTGETMLADVKEVLDDNKDNFNVKVITAPKAEADDTAPKAEADDTAPKAEADDIAAEVKKGDVELHINTTEKNYAATNFVGNRNVSVFFGLGKLEDGTKILASVMAQARKILNRENGTPHLPIAGETHGVFPQFVDVVERLSRKERNTLQGNNVNPLILKTGVGVHFVAQRTRYAGDSEKDKNHRYTKAHINTLVNYIIDVLENVGDKYLHTLNNSKTWDLLNLDIKRQLNLISKGIENYRVLTGRRIMSEKDIIDGVLKAKVIFIPFDVSEQIEFNLVVQDTGNILVGVEEVGGDA